MRERTIRAATFARPASGSVWTQGSGQPGWQSNGGEGKSHPARALPTALEVAVPVAEGRLESISLIGVFALYASPEFEQVGSVGGVIQVFDGTVMSHDRELVSGRHYGDATAPGDVFRLNGDGTSLESVGSTDIDGVKHRVDRLTLDVPGGLRPDRIVLRDLGTPASFLVFDVLFGYEPEAVCPFKGQGGKVALNEIGSILRLRDKRRLDDAMHQLSEGIHQCGRDVDEARGLGLTFLAAVVGALIEMDSTRSMHKVQLEAARELDRLEEPSQIAAATLVRVRDLTDPIVRRGSRSGDETIDRALELVARNFTEDLSVDRLAKDLNLSTSHFRHLFRETTRQPFHKYLVSMRLEKARELLLQTQTPVTEIADSVGFRSSAHFSRAFSKRFGVAPSALRQTRR